MDKHTVNIIMMRFEDYFKDFLRDTCIVGMAGKGMDTGNNGFDIVILPMIVEEVIQQSFIFGIDTPKNVTNLFTNFLRIDREYDVVVRGNRIEFYDKVDDCNIRAVMVDNYNQFFNAKAMLTGDEAFTKGMHEILRLKHMHLDKNFNLHLHEMRGRTNARKECEDGLECGRLGNANRVHEFFESIDIPDINPVHTNAKTIKMLKDNIFSYELS